MIGFFVFHVTHYELLSIACVDQLLYNSSLIKLCSGCVKQNTAVKTASDAYSLLVGKNPSLLITNFEQIIKRFLVLNICLTFFWPMVDSTCYKSTIKSNCMLLSCHVGVSKWICTL